MLTETNMPRGSPRRSGCKLKLAFSASCASAALLFGEPQWAFSEDIASAVEAAVRASIPNADGTIWIRKDCVVSDASKANFRPLELVRNYPLLGQNEKGVWIQCEDVEGQQRCAFVPHRDGMGNPSGQLLSDVFRAANTMGLLPTAALYTLKAGETHAVTKQNSGDFLLNYRERGFNTVLIVPKANVSFISNGDWRNELLPAFTNLAAQALAPASRGDSKAVRSLFENYDGRYSGETAVLRKKLADIAERAADIHYSNLVRQRAEMEQRRKIEENIARGLVQDGESGEWVTKDERQCRVELRERPAKEEAARRQREERLRKEEEQRRQREEMVRKKDEERRQREELARKEQEQRGLAELKREEQAARDAAARKARVNAVGATIFWVVVVTCVLVVTAILVKGVSGGENAKTFQRVASRPSGLTVPELIGRRTKEDYPGEPIPIAKIVVWGIVILFILACIMSGGGGGKRESYDPFTSGLKKLDRGEMPTDYEMQRIRDVMNYGEKKRATY